MSLSIKLSEESFWKNKYNKFNKRKNKNLIKKSNLTNDEKMYIEKTEILKKESEIIKFLSRFKNYK